MMIDDDSADAVRAAQERMRETAKNGANDLRQCRAQADAAMKAVEVCIAAWPKASAAMLRGLKRKYAGEVKEFASGVKKQKQKGAKMRQIMSMIASYGMRASEAAPLAWLSYESEALFGGNRESPRMEARLQVWPGGEARTLNCSDGHVTRVVAPPL